MAAQVATSIEVTESDQQGLATALFSLPFVVFSGFFGFLSDRYGKRGIIVLAKLLEIVVMALGMVAFLSFAGTGYTGLLVVLFLMGTQSAFFGPGKYGILPEIFRERDLPRVNGVILMTTFVAIIFGTGTAGLLGDLFAGDAESGPSAVGLWRGSAICVLIAVAGTISSLWIRKAPAAEPNLKFTPAALAVPKVVRELLWRDRALTRAILASCMFWLAGGVAIQVVNSYGLVQLGLSQTKTSGMTAIVAVGISIGAVWAGRLSHGRADFRLVRIGTWGMAIFYGVMSLAFLIPSSSAAFFFSLPVLTVLGVMTGLFAIPLQVFIQARPPEGVKGRTIAFMNQANFTAIMLSGAVYTLFERLVGALGWPHSIMFAFNGLMLLPLAVLYRPSHDDD